MNTNSILSRIGLVVLASATLFAAGCQKEFLEPKPLSYFEPTATFTTESGLRAALIDCDQELRSEYIINDFLARGILTMEMRISDLCVGGNTDGGHTTALCELDTKVTAVSGYDQSPAMFSDVLGGAVKSANSILDYVDNVPGLDENLRDAYKGRAYFHRAFRYYNMIFQFRNVPLVTHVISSPKLDYKSATRETIIKKMIEDLEFAVAHVPAQSQMDYYGMVNKGACQVLLIKYYLADGRFSDAKNLADEVINNSGYQLMRNPFGIFDEGGEPQTWKITRNIIWDMHRPENKLIAENKETIFGIVNQGSGSSFRTFMTLRNWVPFWANGTNTAPLGGGQSTQRYARTDPAYNAALDFNRGIGRGVGCMRLTWWAENDMWKVNGQMDEGDLRHSESAGNWFSRDLFRYNTKEIRDSSDPEVRALYGKTYREVGSPHYADTIKSVGAVMHYKTFLHDVQKEANPNSNDHQGATLGACSNWYVYRLAEVYLLRAEAKYYMGDPTAAADVNAIRERAHCEQLYTNVTIGDIMDERARELFMEEFRHIELSRVSLCLALSGKPDEWGNTYDINTYDKQEGTDPNGGSYWWQRICHYNNFYNKGEDGKGTHKLGRLTIIYNMNKHNLYLPVPQSAIDANTGNKMWQNFGYDGYDANLDLWTDWHDAVADEEK
jgi:SusD family.